MFVSTMPGDTGDRGMFRWRASDRNMLRVADTTSIAAALDVSAAATFFVFANHGVSDLGIVMFRVRFTSLSPLMSGSAVVTSAVTSDGIVVTPVVPMATSSSTLITKGAVPDQGTTAYFADFLEHTTLNPAGYLLFQGGYAGGTGSHGIYLRTSPGVVSRVIDDRPSLSLPGLPAGAQYGIEGEYYNAMAIGKNGHIAIETPITVGSETDDAVILWDWSEVEWTELTAGDGTTYATNLVSGVSDGGAVLVLAGGTPHIVDRTSGVSIAASMSGDFTGVALTWDDTGGAINNLGRAVVPYTRTAGNTPGLGFWTNQRLVVIVDPAANIPVPDITAIKADSRPETNRPGRSGILNDADEVAFHVTFSDGKEAIYVGRAR
jgi:hypothetical protein